MATNGNKLGFQQNVARLIVFSLKKLNYFQLYFEGYLLEKILLSFAKFLCRKSFLP